tara:strand:+ start:466 stop:1065 length:600 start_codon:yes stop_codon:yes gene_type:complete
MFGFGMTAIDKAILEKTKIMLADIGLSGPQLKSTAKQIFEEVKNDTKTRYGDNLYAENVGDLLIQNNAHMANRRAAGLTEEDVKGYWNRCVLLISIETHIRDLQGFAIFAIAHQTGSDLAEVFMPYRKSNPIYGVTDTWDPNKPVNRLSSAEDADLYFEHKPRVDAWQAKTTEVDRQAILDQYTSFNAMVRDLIRKEQI